MAKYLWMRLAFVCVLAFGGSAAFADDVSPPAQAKAQVSKQFDAFERDDAIAAFALATPGIREMFSDPDNFMDVVRARYAPVYRHRSVEFGDPVVVGESMMLPVTITDKDDVVWTAHYTLDRQSDGQWLISGCALEKTKDQAL